MHRARVELGRFLLIGILLTNSQAVRSQPPPPPDILSIDGVIDVRMVNVEVVVTGMDGEPVRGLAPADFRLLVDGLEMPLAYFSEIVDGRAAPSSPAESEIPESMPPAEPVPRSYLVFVDDSFSVASPRNEHGAGCDQRPNALGRGAALALEKGRAELSVEIGGTSVQNPAVMRTLTERARPRSALFRESRWRVGLSPRENP